MMIVYFLFLITVSSGQDHGVKGCVDRYKSCGQLISKMSATPCRKASVLMKCSVDATAVCSPSFKDTVEKYQMLIEEGCRPRSTLFPDLLGTVQCLAIHEEPFQQCELEGEFNNVAEICSSASHVIDCTRLRTEVLCGNKEGHVFYKVLKPIQDRLEECKNSQDAKDIEVNACYKGLLKCDRRILSRAFRYDCNDVERIFNCYISILSNDCDLSRRETIRIKILEKYMDQIPEYCNPESAIVQGYQRSGFCILAKIGVLEHCNSVYEEALLDAVGHDPDSDESIVALARASVKYRNCFEQKIGSACGDEAAFVARFILEPIAAASDDKCLELTGEKCSGAHKLNSTILFLIFILKYTLTKDDD